MSSPKVAVQTDPRARLISDIGDREVVIWGARMTGIGFARFAKAQGIRTRAFIDSDPALRGKTVSGIRIYPPDYLAELVATGTRFVVVLAVSIKEDEIISSLTGYGLSADDLIVYSKYCKVFYTIDVVGSCNLKCPSCVHGTPDNSMPTGLMSLDTFKKVIDKIKTDAPLVTHVGLYNWGEPFLHPELHHIVDHLHRNDIAVAISSNLSFRFADRLDRVIKANPEYLKVSVSGYFSKAYNNTHTGGDVNLVKSNMYRLRYLIDRYSADTLVDVNYHLYKDNNGINLTKMRELCTELGFVLSTVNALVMPLEKVLKHCEGRPDPDTVRLSENLLVSIDEGISAASMFKSSRCSFMDNQVNINFDLTVPICCTVAERQGNIVEENFLASTPRSIEEKKAQASICMKCMAYGLPEYNMGYNRAAWDEIASSKGSCDSGSTGGSQTT
ncbi:MAG: hypothetical protein HY847_00245 [Betaproteobacteria bacterium]|nr:hypothetical protein [Betaproteobacteria bacterium]